MISRLRLACSLGRMILWSAAITSLSACAAFNTSPAPSDPSPPAPAPAAPPAAPKPKAPKTDQEPKSATPKTPTAAPISKTQPPKKTVPVAPAGLAPTAPPAQAGATEFVVKRFDKAAAASLSVSSTESKPAILLPDAATDLHGNPDVDFITSWSSMVIRPTFPPVRTIRISTGTGSTGTPQAAKTAKVVRPQLLVYLSAAALDVSAAEQYEHIFVAAAAPTGITYNYTDAAGKSLGTRTLKAGEYNAYNRKTNTWLSDKGNLPLPTIETSRNDELAKMLRHVKSETNIQFYK